MAWPTIIKAVSFFNELLLLLSPLTAHILTPYLQHLSITVQIWWKIDRNFSKCGPFQYKLILWLWNVVLLVICWMKHFIVVHNFCFRICDCIKNIVNDHAGMVAPTENVHSTKRCYMRTLNAFAFMTDCAWLNHNIIRAFFPRFVEHQFLFCPCCKT